MNQRFWAKIEEVFHGALELPPHERAAFLEKTCAGDAELLREVRQLLNQDAKSTAHIDTPAEQSAFLQSGALAAGTQLGPYRITGPIGAGGMGAVYRAEDTRLGRTVAIKFMRGSAAFSSSARQRFEREARAIAALNHPHICAVYDVGSASGDDYLVMEYVEGETLGARLKKGPLAFVEALKIACQVADALGVAHAKGIVHRDLKPDNIMLTAGVAKVLDFGLAKTDGAIAASAAATDEHSLTAKGTIVGTAAYMSPEQACGREVDVRTDVWAFGCVLFECLAGKRVFDGSTLTETLAAILERPPDWNALPASTPTALRSLLERCLRKDVNRRLRDIGDARIELEDLLAEPLPAPLPVSRPRTLPYAAIGVAVAAITAAGWFGLRPRAEAPPLHTTKFSVIPKRIARGSNDQIDTELSISPDGRHIAYVEADDSQFWVRDIDLEEPHPIPGAKGVYQAFWSPDGQFVGYANRRNLVKIPITGGTPVAICEMAGLFRRASWSSDGETIVYADTTGLYTVPAKGGNPTQILAHNHIEHPSWLYLPDGRRAILYQTVSTTPPEHDVYVRVLGEAQSRKIVHSASNNPYPAYSPTGHLLYVDGKNEESAIWAAPFSPATLQTTGKAFPLAQHGSSLQVSRTGTLVYGDVPPIRQQLLWCDREGNTLSKIGEPAMQMFPVLSPNNRRLAIMIGEPTSDVWVYELDRGIKTRLTFDPGPHFPNTWSPSGNEITFSSFPNGNPDLYTKSANGNGEPTLLVGTPQPEGGAEWSPDQKHFMYETMSPDTKSDLLYRERGPEGKLGEPAVFLKTPFAERSPKFSPDGRFVAYSSNESGRPEVYVRDFPHGASKWQVSVNGGAFPRWRRDGKELFFIEESTSTLMAAKVATQPAFSPGTPVKLFQKRSLAGAYGNNGFPAYDVASDGNRFVVTEFPPRAPLSIHVVQNWFEEFRK